MLLRFDLVFCGVIAAFALLGLAVVITMASGDCRRIETLGRNKPRESAPVKKSSKYNRP